MKVTEVKTCTCKEPDKDYLDKRYDDLWVCGSCHHFGGSDSWRSNMQQISGVDTMTQCDHHDIQHMEDKLDDFRNAVHDKVLGMESFGKGTLTGLAVMVGFILLMKAFGLVGFNPVVSTEETPTQIEQVEPIQ